MNVFYLIIFEKRGRRCGLFPNLLQSLQNADQLLGREHTRILQRFSVRTAGGKFVLKQPTVETERPLPTLEIGIQRLPEASRPHLHCATSIRDLAREREGKPRM